MANNQFVCYFCLCFLVLAISDSVESSPNAEDRIGKKLILEGRIRFDVGDVEKGAAQAGWVKDVRILVDGGQRLGFVQNDGSFVVNNVEAGWHIVEMTHPENYNIIPSAVRVLVKADGRIRSYAVNHVKPSQATKLAYPLKFRMSGRTEYFEKRKSFQQFLDYRQYDPQSLMQILHSVVAPLLLLLMLKFANPEQLMAALRHGANRDRDEDAAAAARPDVDEERNNSEDGETRGRDASKTAAATTGNPEEKRRAGSRKQRKQRRRDGRLTDVAAALVPPTIQLWDSLPDLSDLAMRLCNYFDPPSAAEKKKSAATAEANSNEFSWRSRIIGRRRRFWQLRHN